MNVQEKGCQIEKGKKKLQTEEKPLGDEQWVPRFAGHQSLEERESSFLARDQQINCGFVKGPEGSQSTGFDLTEVNGGKNNEMIGASSLIGEH